MDASHPTSLVQIAYGDRDILKVNQITDTLAKILREDASGYREAGGLGTLSIDFGAKGEKHQQYQQAAMALYRAKNGSFHEEKEWRILLVDTLSKIENVRFRNTANGISPYVELELPQDALKGVTLGPRNSTPIEFVKSALRSQGFAHHVWIEKSTASYR